MKSKGIKVKIYRQDPDVPHMFDRVAFIHGQVQPGPADADIKVELDSGPVKPNKYGDFLFKIYTPEFDAVHTFTVAWQVLTMYRRALRLIGHAKKLTWAWGTNPLILKPRAPASNDAISPVFSNTSIEFPYFPKRKNGKTVYTCQSFDMVAHEVGHAILYALKPSYMNINNWGSENTAFKEAFGDLTAIFAMLAQMDHVDAIIAESKADLSRKTFFSAIAEQYGWVVYGRHWGLRNADNSYKKTDNFNTDHDFSQVFTGAVYNILAAVFKAELKPNMYDPSETLFRVGQHVLTVFVSAVMDAPDQAPLFKVIAEKMLLNEPSRKWRGLMAREFERRRIF
jgi:hypothetical protein